MSPDRPPTEGSKQEVLIAGFGGQGILFLGQVLAWAALLKGKEVTWLPSYGATMRGGTANCMVIISDRRIVSPFVRFPRVAFILSRPSLLRFQSVVAPEGWLIVDRSVVGTRTEREDIQYLEVPAGEIAQELGDRRLANVVLAGTYTGLFPKYVDYEAGMAALDRLSHANGVIAGW